MANTSRPFGFKPVRYLSAAVFNGQSELYGFSASMSSNAYKGDVVYFDSTHRCTGLTDIYVPMVPVVQPAVAALTTNVIRGVITGFTAAPEFNMTATASLGTLYHPASTAGYVWVVEDPEVVFEAEESGNSYTSITSNAVNKVIDIVYTAGNQTSGISKVKPDATTVVTNAVKPFRVLRYTQRPDNFNFAAADTNSYAHLDLLMNSSDLLGALPTQEGA